MRSILTLLLLLPLALTAADRSLKVDRARSYVDVDVKATVDSFTARLEAYELQAVADGNERIKSATLAFKFADLKTGKPERDTGMIEWLGGGEVDAEADQEEQEPEVLRRAAPAKASGAHQGPAGGGRAWVGGGVGRHFREDVEAASA